MVDFSKHLKKKETNQMARKTQQPETQALAKWDEELAKAAEEAAAQEANTGGGKFFSIRGGTLSADGAPLPGNEMAVIVLDGILVNALYQGDYDPDNPSSPVCYAFGRDEKTIAPHADADEKQAEGCAECPKNQWASAEKGRGKACKNGRRLALIPAGNLAKDGTFEPFEEADAFAAGELRYLNVPPTSIGAYAAYVKQLFATTRRPPHGVYTKVSVVIDGTYPKVVFENIGSVPDEVIPTLIQRNKETRAVIDFPFPKAEARQAQQAAAPRGRLPARAAPRRTGRF